MSPLKAFIRMFPGGKALTDRLSVRRRRRKLEKIGDAEARFTHIYESNAWKDEESRSGSGSSFRVTEQVRAAVPELVAELGVETFLDAPCGDYNWFRHIGRTPAFRYIGGDIVQSMIDANNEAYRSDDTSFMHLDITKDDLPTVNLWMCRDCWVHLSFDMTARAMEKCLEIEIDVLLVTSHLNVEENVDIPTGHCRMINLELPPYNFPPPVRYIEDADFEGTGKHLGLWRREDLQAAAGQILAGY